MTEDIKNQAAYDEKIFVQEFVDWREDNEGRLQLRVSWLGFTSSEDTWEPIERLHEDEGGFYPSKGLCVSFPMHAGGWLL